MALGRAELAGGTELAGVDLGGTELLAGETAPTATSAGFTEAVGPVEAGVAFAIAPGVAIAGDAPGVGVGEFVAPGGRSFISSRRSPLSVLPLCA